MVFVMMTLYLMYGLIAWFIYKTIKKQFNKIWLNKLTLAFFILLPTYDIIITNILGAYYCLTTPSTYITKKVEYPLSIYWEDNVYPGFSKEDRQLMVKNYLNDINLKTIALNGEDNKIYVYEYQNIPQEYYQLKEEYKVFSKTFNQVKKESLNATRAKDEGWKELRDKYLAMDKEVTYKRKTIEELVKTFELKETVYENKQNMPPMNYTVVFNEVPLNEFSRKFLYADETKIIDNQTNEVIAYNRWNMPLFYNIAPDFSQGNKYYNQWSWEICSQRNEHLERETFDTHKWNNWSFGHHKINTNIKLYNKYIKGEK